MNIHDGINDEKISKELKRRSRIVVSGGGTGGHFYPAIAIADFLNSKNYKVFYIGAKRGIENTKIHDYDYDFLLLNAHGWMRSSIFSLFKAVFFLLYNILKLIILFIKNRPSFVICTGGYSCIASGIAAILLHIPLYLQEQNAFPGLTNRLLFPFSKKIFISFDHAIDHFPINLPFLKKKIIKSFNPVRDSFRDDPKENFFVFIGGSQGSEAINSLFLRLKGPLVKLGYKVIIVTGKRFFNKYSDYSDKNISVISFLEKPWELLNSSKFIVSRAGALAISEIIYSACVSILIPYPYAAGDHQFFNSELIIENNAGIRISEKDTKNIDEINLLNTLETSYNDYYKNIKSLRGKIIERDFFKVLDLVLNEDIKF